LVKISQSSREGERYRGTGCRKTARPGLRSGRLVTFFGLKRVHPDIAICNTREVIAIIELKYQPKAQPRYKKDIATLNLLSRYRKKLSLSNTRFRGAETDAKAYQFSPKMLFVWAGIHGELREPQKHRYCRGMRYLGEGYVELHGETSHDALPRVYEKKL